MYISRAARQNEKITELEEKISILEKRLSNTASETQKAVNSIEDICGVLFDQDERKRM